MRMIPANSFGLLSCATPGTCEVTEDSLTSNNRHITPAYPYLMSCPSSFLKAFILNYMHKVCLGATKLFLTYWLMVQCWQRSPLGFGSLRIIGNHMSATKRFVPHGFLQKRSIIQDIGYWRDAKFRQFSPYTGPGVVNVDCLECYYNKV